ncbi:helix-turn-helix domain-containing protein [Chryseobacterium taichungense]|uniref:helix-turn-helix domain-containing protein n=1 Tax=Chryseobacterium taichungense TaxID=295069 RepID=UPI0028AE4FDF|nr:helix-turn-helix domain-containing protein [Chryseobacterium taichungense]
MAKFIFFLLLFFTKQLFSQEKYEKMANESPLKFIEKSNLYFKQAPVEYKPYIILYTAECYYELKEIDKTANCLLELEELLLKNPNKLISCKIYGRMAFLYSITGYKFKSKVMLQNCEQTIKKYLKYDEYFEGRCYFLFYSAMICSKQGRKEEALMYYIKADKEYQNLFSKYKDVNRQIGHSIATNLSDAYFDRKEFKKSLYYAQLAIRRYDNDQYSGAAYVNIANAYSRLGQEDSALVYYDRSIIPLQNERNVEYLNLSFDSIRSIYLQQKNVMMSNYYSSFQRKTLALLEDIDNTAIQQKNDDSIGYTALIIIYTIVLMIIVASIFFYRLKSGKMYVLKKGNSNNSVSNNSVEEIKISSQKISVTPQRNSSNVIPDPKIKKDLYEHLKEQLEEYEKTEFYLNPNTTLAKVAVYLNTSPQNISEMINKNKGMNFSTYISLLRIEYIIRLLKDDEKYRTYKIAYLATVCGFISHSTFTKVFKNLKGVSPSEYIDMLNALDAKH